MEATKFKVGLNFSYVNVLFEGGHLFSGLAQEKFTFKIILKKLEGLTWNAKAIRMLKKQHLQRGD